MSKLESDHPLITLRDELIQEIVDYVRCHSGKWKHRDKMILKHKGKQYQIVKKAIKEYEQTLWIP